MSRPQPRITLHIDRVTVTGTSLSRAALSASIANELQSQLSKPDVVARLRNGGWTPRLDGGSIQARSPGESGLGQAVAQATIGALSQ
ncbi:hypothetical protein [Billgrantia montanilacus]|uniref:Uncharacterized protein n=1 Tax=Billgrantia montanilacus TaxID=2282305 RepID=A0A368TWS6_9GAMM|nr:hypothetical protein [Halomonas montanilacus]RCV89160.1 hypothetical protein DU505_11425 [Halomonas montanilacus]